MTKRNGKCHLCKKKVTGQYKYCTKHGLEVTARKKKAARHKRVELIELLKMSVGCRQCGVSGKGILDLHHKDPSKKVFAISSNHDKYGGHDNLMAEIAKCVVLCSNCHRSHHSGTIDISGCITGVGRK